jgi:hypothetical protein
VYWAGAGAVNSVSSTGGPVSTLASGAWGNASIAVDAASVYWLDNSPSAAPYDAGTLRKVPLHGGAVATLATAGPAECGASNVAALPLPVVPGRIAKSVYWTTDYDCSNSNDSSLMSVPAAGGNAITLAALDGPGSLAADATALYWDTGPALWSTPTSGGTPISLAAAGGVAGIAIAVDATSLYWIQWGDMNQCSVMKLTPK